MAGCLGPRSDPSTFYLLTPAATPSAGMRVPVTLGLGPVTVPSYLDRPEIVTRLGEHQVALSQVERWAEPLRDNVRSALAANLMRLLQPDGVVAYPWHASAGVDYGISVHLTRFESDSSGAVRLEARWAVVDEATGAQSASGTAEIDEMADGVGRAASVAALSRALAALSQELAAAIQEASAGGT